MIRSQIEEEIRLSLTISKGSFFKRPEFGHRLNELSRAVASETTRNRAEKYARDALQWMIDIKHLRSVEVYASYDRDDRLLINIEAIPFNDKQITFKKYVEVGDVSNS